MYLANNTEYRNLTTNTNVKSFECYKFTDYWLSWSNQNVSFGRGEDRNQSLIATWDVQEDYRPNKLYIRGKDVNSNGFVQWKFDRDYGMNLKNKVDMLTDKVSCLNSGWRNYLYCTNQSSHLRKRLVECKIKKAFCYICFTRRY